LPGHLTPAKNSRKPLIMRLKYEHAVSVSENFCRFLLVILFAHPLDSGA
jgi:hypothetical protein